ncbi:hypothetical protein N7492_010401 [Penicillium capsulatum]|uniref:Secretory lipase-domain-containing protein n=1 Tax=Penicillium capsulatum TaxID=69766 RepID=A0A9W9LDV0_9EURO|nr:hypothetical protein N7492_010401 [Penicillium capsulatum]KAJ6112905.1 hypothetical protein N7512_008229 [Penicillium capsulatum]
MRFFFICLSVLIFGAQQALSDSHLWPLPVRPSDDPFYKPPAGDEWTKKPQGSILKIRPVTISSLIPLMPSKAKAYQLLYSTLDVHGKADATVTTIIVPVEPDFTRVLSYQNAYDSADINCGPSYGMQFQVDGWASTWNMLNLAFVMPFLQKGPILNIPDYEGSNGAFTVGPQSAFQTLDSIRAALQSGEHTNISADANVIMFGYSGGAFATEWATEKKAWYAPELPIVGAAMGGPPPNVSQTYKNVNGGPLAELNIAAMLGVMNAFPDMDEWMRADLKDDEYQKSRFLFPLEKCSGLCKDVRESLAGEDVSFFFKSYDKFLYRYKERLEEIGVMGQNITWANRPKYRLMFFYGANDEVTAPVEATQNLVKKWRSVALVASREIPRATHTTALLPGLPKAWRWINWRFKNAEEKASLGETDEDAIGVDREFDELEADDDEFDLQAQMILGLGGRMEL